VDLHARVQRGAYRVTAIATTVQYRKRMPASARSLSLRSKTRYSPTGVNAGSNVPKCAEVKILSWAGFSVISRLDKLTCFTGL
jgi:hypothetical protein